MVLGYLKKGPKRASINNSCDRYALYASSDLQRSIIVKVKKSSIENAVSVVSDRAPKVFLNGFARGIVSRIFVKNVDLNTKIVRCSMSIT